MFSPPITGNIDLDAFLYDIYLGGAGGDVAPVSAVLSNSGSAVGYKNKYIQVKYADDNVGTNLDDAPTGKYFFGINNVDSATESTTPADYTWFEVSEGFGSLKKFWYVSTGGRQLDYYIGTAGPTALYVYDTGGAIDLDVVTSVGNLSARVAYATSTLASLSSSPSTVTTIGNTSVPPINSWAGQETWSSTPEVGGIGTSLFRTDGLYNSTTSLTSWSPPYLSSIRVGSLSAISANMGSLTSGTITGATFLGGSSTNYTTGTGLFSGLDASIYKFRVGDPTGNNISWDGSNLNVTGGGTFSGDLSAASGTFSGSLTASAINAVDTINVAGNAITIPAGSSASGFGATVTIVVDYAAPVVMIATFYGQQISGFGPVIRRNGVIVAQGYSASSGGVNPIIPITITGVDNPGVGTHVYTVGRVSYGGGTTSNTTLFVLGAKR